MKTETFRALHGVNARISNDGGATLPWRCFVFGEHVVSCETALQAIAWMAKKKITIETTAQREQRLRLMRRGARK